WVIASRVVTEHLDGCDQRSTDDSGNIKFHGAGNRFRVANSIQDSSSIDHDCTTSGDAGNHDRLAAERPGSCDVFADTGSDGRDDTVHMGNLGWVIASRVVTEHLDGCDQRNTDDSGNIKFHGAGNRFRVANSIQDSSSIDHDCTTSGDAGNHAGDGDVHVGADSNDYGRDERGDDLLHDERDTADDVIDPIHGGIHGERDDDGERHCRSEWILAERGSKRNLYDHERGYGHKFGDGIYGGGDDAQRQGDAEWDTVAVDRWRSE